MNTADAWLQEIIDDRPEGAYKGRDMYERDAARRAQAELRAFAARVDELESEVRQYREDMAAVSDAIGARGVATTPGLLSFIAKLGVPNGTEWGVRRINDPAVENPDGAYALLRVRSDAQRVVDRDPARWELVNRRPPG